MKRLRSAVKRLMYGVQPSAPSTAKWTKLLPAAKWFMTAMIPGVLQQSCKKGFKTIKPAPPLDANLDHALAKDLTYSAVLGARMKRFKEMAASVEQREKITSLGIVSEAISYLTEHFVSGTSEKRARENPIIFNMIDPRRSPIDVVLCYFSTLLQGGNGIASRLVLLFRPGGFRSMGAWGRARPASAKLFRDMVLMASVGIDDRHRRPFREEPFTLAALGDPVQTEAVRRNFARRFLARRPCCTPWCVRPWLDKTEATLLSARWACLTWRWSSMLMCSIADIECRHARNRRDAHDLSTFDNFVARYINAESKAVVTTCTQRRLATQQQLDRGILAIGADDAWAAPAPMLMPEAPEPSDDDPSELPLEDAAFVEDEQADVPAEENDLPEGALVAVSDEVPLAYAWMRTTTRKLSALNILRRRVRADLVAQGHEAVSGVSDALWEMTRERWRTLSAAAKAELEHMSDLSKWIAMRNRIRNREEAQIEEEPERRLADVVGRQRSMIAWPAQSLHSLAVPPPRPPIMMGVKMASGAVVPRPDETDEGAPGSVKAAGRRPMTVRALEAELRRPGVTNTMMSNKLTADAHVPACDRGAVGRVRYYDIEHCRGGFCNQQDEETTRSKGQLVRRLGRIFDGVKSADVRAQDMFLAVDFHDAAARHVATEMFVVLTLKKRWAHHHERILLVRMELLPGQTPPPETALQGLRYRYRRRDLVDEDGNPYQVKADAREPFGSAGRLANEAKLGGLFHVDHHEWARILFCDMATTHGAPSKLVVNRLKHKSCADVGPDVETLDEYLLEGDAEVLYEVVPGDGDSDDDAGRGDAGVPQIPDFASAASAPKARASRPRRASASAGSAEHRPGARDAGEIGMLLGADMPGPERDLFDDMFGGDEEEEVAQEDPEDEAEFDGRVPLCDSLGERLRQVWDPAEVFERLGLSRGVTSKELRLKYPEGPSEALGVVYPFGATESNIVYKAECSIHGRKRCSLVIQCAHMHAKAAEAAAMKWLAQGRSTLEADHKGQRQTVKDQLSGWIQQHFVVPAP